MKFKELIDNPEDIFIEAKKYIIFNTKLFNIFYFL